MPGDWTRKTITRHDSRIPSRLSLAHSRVLYFSLWPEGGKASPLKLSSRKPPSARTRQGRSSAPKKRRDFATEKPCVWRGKEFSSRSKPRGIPGTRSCLKWDLRSWMNGCAGWNRLSQLRHLTLRSSARSCRSSCPLPKACKLQRHDRAERSLRPGA